MQNGETVTDNKHTNSEQAWHLVDAKGLVLGRVAAEIAKILRGKHKASYVPYMDCGDKVVVVNARQIALTGRKYETKTYYRHTGYPGGLKSRTAREIIESAHSERVLVKAVERMLPRGPLGRQVMRNLRVYADAEHPHRSQNPRPLDLAARNPKNMKERGALNPKHATQ